MSDNCLNEGTMSAENPSSPAKCDCAWIEMLETNGTHYSLSSEVISSERPVMEI
jgi:hypothetical protein